MSALVGQDVRAGTHPCYERFVIELQTAPDAPSSEFPGYWVRYATGPVQVAPEGSTATVRGGAVLLASLGSWMRRPDGLGYDGPNELLPPSPSVIQELRLIEDFEGQSTWAIGVDTRRDFAVSVLADPSRLVVDIRTSP
jgi:hypothetical protein